MIAFTSKTIALRINLNWNYRETSVNHRLSHLKPKTANIDYYMIYQGGKRPDTFWFNKRHLKSNYYRHANANVNANWRWFLVGSSVEENAKRGSWSWTWNNERTNERSSNELFYGRWFGSRLIVKTCLNIEDSETLDRTDFSV